MVISGENQPTAWFFGTFNPVHNGHLQVARAVLAHFPALETVTLVPTGHPPHKAAVSPDLLPIRHRLAMATLAAESEPRLKVSDAEAADSQDPHYTYETLKKLGLFHLNEPPVLILGVDAFNSLEGWHQAARLLESTDFLVAPRNGVTPKTSFMIGNQPIDPRFSLIPMPEIAIAASDIRYRLHEELPLDEVLPPAVENYIRRHGLYRPQAAANTPLKTR